MVILRLDILVHEYEWVLVGVYPLIIYLSHNQKTLQTLQISFQFVRHIVWPIKSLAGSLNKATFDKYDRIIFWWIRKVLRDRRIFINYIQSLVHA